MGVEEVMKSVVEKLKEFLIAIEKFVSRFSYLYPHQLSPKHVTHTRESKMCVEEVTKSVVEKLKEFPIAIEKFAGEELAWFDGVFPPETRADKIRRWIHLALPYLIAAVVLTAVICCFRCCCRCCRGRGRARMMKAPGRNCTMRRSVFESDPKGYFWNLRANPGDEFC